jgi:isoquinoline 1-oxidoreductase
MRTSDSGVEKKNRVTDPLPGLTRRAFLKRMGLMGGGFGGKSASAQAVEAARLSKKSGRPVMVAWTREEEFFFDTFRPAAVVKIRSGLGAAGRMTLWDYKVYFAGRRGCQNFYTIPHHREAVHGEWRIEAGIHPFAVGPWRAPAANTNAYARDLHLHLMASLADQDPLEFPLQHLEDKRMRRVFEAAASRPSSAWAGCWPRPSSTPPAPRCASCP